MNLSNKKRALITGASSGIGKATALAFAGAGIDVVLVGRSEDKLRSVAQLVNETGAHAVVYCLDLAKVESVKDQISTIIEQEGFIEILINNAGMGYTNTLADTPLEDWQQVINLNVTSVYQCIQAVLPSMRQHKTGTIINVSSIAGYNYFPGWCAYNVSKAALVSLSKTVAAEESAHNIRISVIAPGSTNTALWDTPTVQADFDRSKMMSAEMVAQAILNAVLLPQAAVIEFTITPTVWSL